MSNLNKTQELALSSAASIKNKNGKKWEQLVERKFQKNEILPKGKLKGSMFKRKTYDMYNNGEFFKKKIIDQWLPKYNHLVECKNSIGDAQLTEFMIATDSLNQSSEYGDNYKYVALIKETPDDRFTKKLKELSDRHSNFLLFYGERGVDDYIQNYLIPITQIKLPYGNFEMTRICELEDNDINRELDYDHVNDLVDSLLSKNKDGIRGLVRPLIGIKNNGKKKLVDAHHLKAALNIVNNFTQYTIDEVPVYYLTHLENIEEEELTMLMSVINTLVLKWDTYSYVKMWHKTYDKLNKLNHKYSYEKLKESMERLSPDNPNSSPITQAFCFTDRSEEKNWKSNTKKIHEGQLMFDEEYFNNKLLPIVLSIEKLKDAIKFTRNVVGGKYTDPNSGEIQNTPSSLAAVIRGYATELSLQEYDSVDKKVYYESLKELSDGYWEDQVDILPMVSTIGQYTKEDFELLTDFPRTADEMKKMVSKRILAPLIRKTSKKLQKQ